MRRLAAFLLLFALTALAQNKLQILYIANGMNRGGKGGAITAYKIASNGKLTPVIGSPFDAAIIPYGISTDNGKHLYVANPAIDDNNLRVYPIRPDTGRLEFEHLSTFAGTSYEAERNCCPGPMIADHDGRFVYVGNTSDKTIAVYDVFPGSLALTQISKANTAPGHFPVDLVWGPRQLSLFTFTDSGLEESLLQVYRRNPQKGLLTEASGSPLKVPYLIQIAVTDRLLIALTTSPAESQLNVYAISNGTALSPVVGSPFPLPPKQRPFTMTVHPSNQWLALANANPPKNSTNVSLYRLQSNQAPSLAKAVDIPCTKPCSITSMTFDLTGKFLYIADTANEQVIGFEFSPADGSLRPISGSPWKSNFQPHSLLAVEPR
jgi:6-phosphogluconolactonase (cycloisomerase 2 family)